MDIACHTNLSIFSYIAVAAVCLHRMPSHVVPHVWTGTIGSKLPPPYASVGDTLLVGESAGTEDDERHKRGQILHSMRCA